MNFHINDAGNVGACKATVQQCPLGGEHYDTFEQATEASVKGLDEFTVISKKEARSYHVLKNGTMSRCHDGDSCKVGGNHYDNADVAKSSANLPEARIKLERWQVEQRKLVKKHGARWDEFTGQWQFRTVEEKDAALKAIEIIDGQYEAKNTEVQSKVVTMGLKPWETEKREIVKKHGARWDATNKVWKFENAEKHAAALKSIEKLEQNVNERNHTITEQRTQNTHDYSSNYKGHTCSCDEMDEDHCLVHNNAARKIFDTTGYFLR